MNARKWIPAALLAAVCLIAGGATLAGAPVVQGHGPTPAAGPQSTPQCFYESPRIDGIEANLQGFTFDGQYFWAADETAHLPVGEIPPGRILKIDPDTFELLAYYNHPSTSIGDITYDPHQDRFVTTAPLGGPPESPWDAEADFLMIHDPVTLSVTQMISINFPTSNPLNISAIEYNEPTRTYISVSYERDVLTILDPIDFSVIKSYPLPESPDNRHTIKGVTLVPIPGADIGYIFVTYYPEPLPGIPGAGPDEEGWMLKIMEIVDDAVVVHSTLRAIDGHVFAVGDLAWDPVRQRLVTTGIPWLEGESGEFDIGQVGFYIHDLANGCYPIERLPDPRRYIYLPWGMQ